MTGKRAPKAYAKPVQSVMCLQCGETVEQHPDGRPRLYCGTRCRVAAHRAKARRGTGDQPPATQ